MALGRPSKFTDKIQEEILSRLRDGETARAIMRDAHMPSWQAFCKFKRNNEAFIAQYTRACEDHYQAWEQEIIEISKDDSRDLQPDGKGGVKSDNTAVNRDRLRIDTMKWIMCKRLPQVYGEKQEITGKDGAPFQPVLNINIEK